MDICEAVIELINYSLNGIPPVKYRNLVVRKHSFGLPFIEPIEMVLNPREIFINTRSLGDSQAICALFTKILTEINKHFCGPDKVFQICSYSPLGSQKLTDEYFKIHETNSSIMWTRDNPSMRIDISMGFSKHLRIEFGSIEGGSVPMDAVVIN